MYVCMYVCMCIYIYIHIKIWAPPNEAMGISFLSIYVYVFSLFCIFFKFIIYRYVNIIIHIVIHIIIIIIIIIIIVWQ